MTRRAIADLRHKIEHSGGIYDSRVYRYVFGRDGQIYKVKLSVLDTAAVYNSWTTLRGKPIDRQTAKEIIF